MKKYMLGLLLSSGVVVTSQCHNDGMVKEKYQSKEMIEVDSRKDVTDHVHARHYFVGGEFGLNWYTPLKTNFDALPGVTPKTLSHLHSKVVPSIALQFGIDWTHIWTINSKHNGNVRTALEISYAGRKDGVTLKYTDVSSGGETELRQTVHDVRFTPYVDWTYFRYNGWIFDVKGGMSICAKMFGHIKEYDRIPAFFEDGVYVPAESGGFSGRTYKAKNFQVLGLFGLSLGRNFKWMDKNWKASLVYDLTGGKVRYKNTIEVGEPAEDASQNDWALYRGLLDPNLEWSEKTVKVPFFIQRLAVALEYIF